MKEVSSAEYASVLSNEFDWWSPQRAPPFEWKKEAIKEIVIYEYKRGSYSSPDIVADPVDVIVNPPDSTAWVRLRGCLVV